MSDNVRQAQDRLPAAVDDLAVRPGVKPVDNRLAVELTQSGRMKRKLGVDTWMDFTAAQTISTRRCEFDWRARAVPLGIISARDTLKNSEEGVDFTALGLIPVGCAEHSSALMRGELMRYLAELAWAPYAILLNRALRWRLKGPDTLAISAGAEEVASEVILGLDSAGRITWGFAADRPRSASAPCLPTPWRGWFSDYRHHDGFWIPFAGEFAWEIDGTEEVYGQGRIENWETQ
jgi:hypothetical protein